MIISTYNINSIKARLSEFLDWLQKASPDIVLLQEIKCEFNAFPFFEIQSAGYNVKMIGQKSYNGVAVLSKHKVEVVHEGLPDFDDENARYLEVLVHNEKNTIRVASVYLPNGNPPYNNPDDESKFEYKLRFMDALYNHVLRLRQNNDLTVIGGDFNVILTDNDVYNPKAFLHNALFREPVKQRLYAIEYLGFYDSFRMLHSQENGYTYWDYGAQAFMQDLGMRIDYLFLSPKLADCLQSCEVDKSLRKGEKPSDHTPLIATFNCSERF